MAHAAACRATFTQVAVSNVACKAARPGNVSSFLVSCFRGFRLAPVARPVQNGRKQVGVVMAEGLTAAEIADEEAFLAEKKKKLAERKAGNEEGGEEKKGRPAKTPEEKAAYKAHLRRRRLDRKRKLRKVGRWPPLKANVDQPSNPRKRVKRKAK